MEITPVQQVRNNFVAIANTFTKIANEFETEYIPINTIKIVLKDYRTKKVWNDSNVDEYLKHYNKLLSTLQDTCIQVADRHPSNKVPLKIIKLFINQITSNL